MRFRRDQQNIIIGEAFLQELLIVVHKNTLSFRAYFSDNYSITEGVLQAFSGFCALFFTSLSFLQDSKIILQKSIDTACLFAILCQERNAFVSPALCRIFKER